MGKRVSWQTRKELLEAVRRRYRESSKRDKKGILSEFVALTGYHRKHVVRLLRQAACSTEAQVVHAEGVGIRRVYDEAVKEALIIIWEASDRICGKRVKAILPELLEAMESHGQTPPEKKLTIWAYAASIAASTGDFCATHCPDSSLK